jgi:molybdate transport system regulatory protein
MKEIRIRCWIENDGQKLFGPGPFKLIQLIEEEGSIAAAAKKMNMSYKKAWDIIQHLNSSLDAPVVISQKGGSKGGGAIVTSRGKKLMVAFETLNQKLINTIQENQEILSLLD